MANFESKSLKSIETLGEILKKHRSELNLSMNQIARQFQINTRYLQALENDAYDQMPADIYTHNFLKKYASLLGLNASSLISLHEREKNLYLKTKKKDKSKINNLSLGSKFLNKILEPKKIKAFFILLLFVIILTYIGFSISKIFSPPELIIKEPSENSIITQNTTLEIKGVTEEEVDSIPTGCLSLDIALGVGGVPRGRIIEIYGPESSGKTTLAQHIASETQKRGGIAAFVDAEHALDPEYAQKIGININELLISQPDTGEQALEIVETLVRSGGVDTIIIDSVAALVPKAEIEGEMGDQHMGLQARLMSQALRKLAGIVGKTQTTVVFLNLIRHKIGVFFGNPETTTGGNALKFYSSVRIEVRRSAQIKKGEEIIGNQVKCKIVKNKVAAPFQTTTFDIMYNEGISIPGDVLDVGLKYKILSKSGNSYTYGEEKLGVGRETAKDYLRQNPKLIEKIKKEVWKAIEVGPIAEEQI